MLWGRGNEKGSNGEAKTAYYGSQGRSPTLTIIVRMGGSPTRDYYTTNIETILKTTK